MKLSTSFSLAPCLSCSRTLFFRSTARSALESASDWFWHTRQRNSSAMRCTRLSSTASSAASTGIPTKNKKFNKIKYLRIGIQLRNQRQDLFLQHQGRHRADVLVADHAALVDHIGLRYAIHTVVYA